MQLEARVRTHIILSSSCAELICVVRSGRSIALPCKTYPAAIHSIPKPIPRQAVRRILNYALLNCFQRARYLHFSEQGSRHLTVPELLTGRQRHLAEYRHNLRVSNVQCCFTSTETIRLIRDEGSPGRPPRLSHSSGIRVQVRCWFTFTETIRTIHLGRGIPGRPHRLPHSS